jgi:hypothetical protein
LEKVTTGGDAAPATATEPAIPSAESASAAITARQATETVRALLAGCFTVARLLPRLMPRAAPASSDRANCETTGMREMKMPARTIYAFVTLAVVALVAAGAVIYATNGSSPARDAASSSGAPAARATGASTLTVENATEGQPIPAGFVGLTTEYRGLEAYAGTNPATLDPVFEQLIRNLAPGQSPVLRIGGDSTDWTWWPVPHMARPGGVKYTLNQTWLQVASALAKNLDARLILGINFEADSGRVASAEGQAFVGGIGRERIAALELGNEPELYAAFPWYKLPDGQHVRGRPPTYDYPEFIQDFANVSRSIPRDITLAGPSTGSSVWIPVLGQFLAANRDVGLATLHRYPSSIALRRAR